jgi:hypothetical protein
MVHQGSPLCDIGNRWHGRVFLFIAALDDSEEVP